MADEFGDKVHDATPHRREQARQEGQVARSQDLASAVLLVGGGTLLLSWGGEVVMFLVRVMQSSLGGDAWLVADRDLLINQWNSLVWGAAQALLPMFGAMMAIAIAVNIYQVGLLWLPNKIMPDLTRLDPLKGLGRIFSTSNVIHLGFGSLKVLLVAASAVWFAWGKVNTLLNSHDMELPQIAVFLSETTLWICLKIGVVLLILALFDYFYQFWKYEQDLKMTHQEVRDELKSTQGNPEVAGRRKQAQRQLALTRLKTSIPKADVVVTNPTELAIAIRYDLDTMAAPVVVAKGAGLVAQRIRRLALENNIPIVERKELARALYKQVEIGAAIPPEQYTAVAEVLRYVYQLKGKTEETLRKAAGDERFGKPPAGAKPANSRRRTAA